MAMSRMMQKAVSSGCNYQEPDPFSDLSKHDFSFPWWYWQRTKTKPVLRIIVRRRKWCIYHGKPAPCQALYSSCELDREIPGQVLWRGSRRFVHTLQGNP